MKLVVKTNAGNASLYENNNKKNRKQERIEKEREESEWEREKERFLQFVLILCALESQLFQHPATRP